MKLFTKLNGWPVEVSFYFRHGELNIEEAYYQNGHGAKQEPVEEKFLLQLQDEILPEATASWGDRHEF